MNSLHLSEGGSPRGKRKGANPGILFVQRGAPSTEENGLVVARGAEENSRSLLQKLSPTVQKILNVLQKNKQQLCCDEGTGIFI